jgi:muramoyltetrapeptide carboxypeptidase
VRAVFATRGGKGSYRIADGIDFLAVEADPKPLVGFSDITVLHLMLWKQCRLAGIHGTVLEDNPERPQWQNNEALRLALTQSGWLEIDARADESTALLTTSGRASGPLIGGNLDMIATAAGWALPSLYGAILLIEGVEMAPGQVDRQLTMLRKAGHLEGVAGIALGQFTKCRDVVLELLHHHLGELEVPILGGLPLGHGARPTIAPIGTEAQLDAGLRRLSVAF